MANGKWKIERYTLDVIQNSAEFLEQFSGTGLREAAILTSAILDVALAETIKRRLIGPEDEMISFLGANEDGRAPCGSFGSRIQLSRSLGIITDEDVRLLRNVKKLRNAAAHRIKVDVDQSRIGQTLLAIWDDFKGPVGVQVAFGLRLWQNDPKIVDLLRRSKSQEEIDKSIAAIGEIVSKHRESNFILPDGIRAEDIPFLYMSYIPKLLVALPNIGVYLLAAIAGLYKGRFDLLLETMKPIDRVRLPSRALKMWESDEFEASKSITPSDSAE